MDNLWPDLSKFTPARRPGATLVCNSCCSKGRLYPGEDCIIYDCPDHMLMTMRDGKVITCETRGSRS